MTFLDDVEKVFESRLSKNEKIVLISLLYCVNKYPTFPPCPSQRDISLDCSMTLQHVGRALNNLKLQNIVLKTDGVYKIYLNELAEHK